jgi:hypothetical protein
MKNRLLYMTLANLSNLQEIPKGGQMWTKSPALFIIIFSLIAFTGCTPALNTASPSLEESEAPQGVELQENDPNLTMTDEPAEILDESTPTGAHQNQAVPTATEEIPTMSPGNLELSDPDQLPQVKMAREDLASFLNIPIDRIEILKVELVTWPNGGMGCPDPEMVYKQVPVDGLLIQLTADGNTYSYHSGGSRDPFLCQPSPPAKSTPLDLNIEDYITPPSGNIDN